MTLFQLLLVVIYVSIFIYALIKTIALTKEGNELPLAITMFWIISLLICLAVLIEYLGDIVEYLKKSYFFNHKLW